MRRGGRFAFAKKAYLRGMFWSEDEIDREGLLQRFEAEYEAGTLGYYSWAALELLLTEYLEAEDLVMADRVVAHAQYLYGGESRLHLLYSYLALAKSKLIEALAHIQKAFQLMAPDPAVYEQYVDILVQLGRYEEAYWLLEAYMESFPEMVREIWRYGIVLFRNVGAWPQVKEVAWQGLPHALPYETAFWWHLVRAYERLGQIGQGIQDFWEAVWAEPFEYRLWLGLAHLYQRKLSYRQALLALDEAEKLLASGGEEEMDNWWALYYHIRARVYEAMGEWEEAFRAHLWIRHYRPQVVSALVGIIRYYHRQERWSEAEPHLRQAVRLAGHRPGVQALAAEHLWAQGDWDLAAQLYESLLSHQSHAETAVERLLVHLSERADRKAFLRILYKASRTFPDRPDLWLRWSMQAFSREQVLFAWYIADYAMRMTEKRHLTGALYFWHAGLAWRLGHRRRALHSLEQGLLRGASQAVYLRKAFPEGELPLPFQHLLRRYQQLT